MEKHTHKKTKKWKTNEKMEKRKKEIEKWKKGKKETKNVRHFLCLRCNSRAHDTLMVVLLSALEPTSIHGE